jgi:NADH dehydrogenase [ubiquinone] 1 alpha subcomplex assembly factor 1
MTAQAESLVTFSAAESLSEWKTVDDVVMGGVSSSQLSYTPGALRFAGHVSLEQNGGFCSARNRGHWDLTDASELIWTLRGTPRHFQATIRTADIPESASFRHPFEPQPDTWQDFRFKLDDFRLYRRGQMLSTAARLDVSHVVSFGILLADKAAGPFWLELAHIGYR